MNYIHLIVLLQVDIEKKMSNAPDKGYEIGIAIGTYLPFVVLVLIAYFIFYKARNKKNLNE